jgi:hypothetical protein
MADGNAGIGLDHPTGDRQLTAHDRRRCVTIMFAHHRITSASLTGAMAACHPAISARINRSTVWGCSSIICCEVTTLLATNRIPYSGIEKRHLLTAGDQFVGQNNTLGIAVDRPDRYFFLKKGV